MTNKHTDVKENLLSLLNDELIIRRKKPYKALKI